VGATSITKKGKTKGKNLGDSGPTVATQNGPIKGTVGKTNADMKKIGTASAMGAMGETGQKVDTSQY